MAEKPIAALGDEGAAKIQAMVDAEAAKHAAETTTPPVAKKPAVKPKAEPEVDDREPRLDLLDPFGVLDAAEAAEKKATEEAAKAKADKEAADAVAKAKGEEKPPHSERLLRLADFYGIPRVNANGMTSEQLRNEISEAKLESEAIELSERRRAAQAEKKTEPTTKPVEDDIDWGEIEDEANPGKMRKAKEEDISPIIARQLKLLAKQNREIQAERAAEKQTMAQREAAARVQVLDNAFLGMKEYEKLLGTVASEDADPSNAEHVEQFERRKAIMAAGKVDLNKDNAATVAKKIKAGAKILYGEGSVSPPVAPPAPAKPAAKPPEPKPLDDDDAALAKRQAEWEAGRLQKPSGRKGVGGDNPLSKKLAEIRDRDGDDDGDSSTGMFDDLPEAGK